jgi:hypothetical protein
MRALQVIHAFGGAARALALTSEVEDQQKNGERC